MHAPIFLQLCDDATYLLFIKGQPFLLLPLARSFILFFQNFFLTIFFGHLRATGNRHPPQLQQLRRYGLVNEQNSYSMVPVAKKQAMNQSRSRKRLYHPPTTVERSADGCRWNCFCSVDKIRTCNMHEAVPITPFRWHHQRASFIHSQIQ